MLISQTKDQTSSLPPPYYHLATFLYFNFGTTQHTRLCGCLVFFPLILFVQNHTIIVLLTTLYTTRYKTQLNITVARGVVPQLISADSADSALLEHLFTTQLNKHRLQVARRFSCPQKRVHTGISHCFAVGTGCYTCTDFHRVCSTLAVQGEVFTSNTLLTHNGNTIPNQV